MFFYIAGSIIFYVMIMGVLAPVYAKYLPTWKCNCCHGGGLGCGYWLPAFFWPISLPVVASLTATQRLINRPKPAKQLEYCLCPECEQKFLSE